MGMYGLIRVYFLAANVAKMDGGILPASFSAM